MLSVESISIRRVLRPCPAYGRCNVDNLWNNPHINPEMSLIQTLQTRLSSSGLFFLTPLFFIPLIEKLNDFLQLSTFSIVELFYNLNTIQRSNYRTIQKQVLSVEFNGIVANCGDRCL